MQNITQMQLLQLKAEQTYDCMCVHLKHFSYNFFCPTELFFSPSILNYLLVKEMG